MITREQAMRAHRGDTFHHKNNTNADGTPVRARVNGACQTWKTRPDEFRLPMKHGLRTCFYITQDNACYWVTDSAVFDGDTCSWGRGEVHHEEA